MGAGAFSEAVYLNAANTRRARGETAFAYSDSIEKGQIAADVHPLLNPFNVMRESRDSPEHPNSNAVAMMFDVTGSMRTVPVVFQQQLPRLMSLITGNNYLEHPQLLVGAVGDIYSDRAPLQVGQFESDNRIEADLSRIYLEGNGGGFGCESYEVAANFLARRTSLDCFEKRKRKGYAFFMGDEQAYDDAQRPDLDKWCGSQPVPVPHLPAVAAFRQLAEKYHVYFIIPQNTTGGMSSALVSYWVKILPRHVITLARPEMICECIAALIALTERHSLASVLSALPKSSGLDKELTALRNKMLPDDFAVPEVRGRSSTRPRIDRD